MQPNTQRYPFTQWRYGISGRRPKNKRTINKQISTTQEGSKMEALMDDPSEITVLLRRLSEGDREAENDLIPQVYNELHRLAAVYLRKERSDHTLQPTALVNEAYLRIAGHNSVSWKGRAHFFAVAGQIMRRILTDHARRKLARKRGGDWLVLPLNDSLQIDNQQCKLLADLDEALERLAEIDERAARVVELRFFGGLKDHEIAELMQISPRSVKRIWFAARAWLYGELSDLPPGTL